MPLRLTRGTQVLYVPPHADGDLNHPDVEQGFVTSNDPVVVTSCSVFVRYFHKYDPHLLRTVANSELTRRVDLVVRDHRDQGEIDELLKELGYNDEWNGQKDVARTPEEALRVIGAIE